MHAHSVTHSSGENYLPLQSAKLVRRKGGRQRGLITIPWHRGESQIKYVMGPGTTKIPASNFMQNEKGPQIPELCVWSLGDKVEAEEGDSSDKTQKS